MGCAIALGLGASPFLPALTLAASMAMGLQATAVQQLGVPGVATVVVTGTLTTAVARLVGAASSPPHTASVNSMALPFLSWAGYFTGALLGGLQKSLLHAGLPIALPGLLLVAVAVIAGRFHRPANP